MLPHFLVVVLCLGLGMPFAARGDVACGGDEAAEHTLLLKSLMHWIADHSRYQLVDQVVPRLAFVPDAEIDRLANPGRTIDDWQDVEACFLTDEITIYLSDRFDADDLFHRSTLVHELVHFMQLINGAFRYAECPAALERPAYFLQVDYLDQHGFDWPSGLREQLRLAGYVIGRCPPGHLD